jgi:hypothetical protein
MSNYVARWNNAKVWANRINAALAAGYDIKWKNKFFNWEIKNPLTISDKGIYHVDGRSTIIIFENDPTVDHGLHTPIDEWNTSHEVVFFKTQSVGLDEVDFDTQNMLNLIDEKRFALYESYKPIIMEIINDKSLDLNQHREIVRAMARLMLTETSTYFNRKEKLEVRVAIAGFLIDLESRGLGPDEHGVAMTKLYQTRLGEIQDIIFSSEAGNQE